MKKNDEEKTLFRLNGYLYPNQYPNCIGTEHDYDGPGRGGVIVYYKEDMEKMKGMTTEEMIAYKRQLRKEGRYTEE